MTERPCEEKTSIFLGSRQALWYKSKQSNNRGWRGFIDVFFNPYSSTVDGRQGPGRVPSAYGGMMQGLRHHLGLVGAVYRRHLEAFIPDWRTYIVGNVLNPLAFLAAFGYGLGSFIEMMGGLDYFVYLLAGALVYTTMFSTSLEVALTGYQRAFGDRLYDTMLTTPVTLNHIVVAEILWGVSKSVLTAGVLLLVAFTVYDMPVSAGAGVLAWGLSLLFCFTFAATALVFMAYAKSFEFFAYFFVLWISPGMFFGGVFYDLDNLPDWVQLMAQCHPVTQGVAMMRPLLGNLYMDPWEFAARLGYMLLFGLVMALWARAKLKTRLFS